VLAYEFGLEGAGVWTGLAIGLAAACLALVWRFAARRRFGLGLPRRALA
jgi:Na+-driven multidrug efflux pump